MDYAPRSLVQLTEQTIMKRLSSGFQISIIFDSILSAHCSVTFEMTLVYYHLMFVWKMVGTRGPPGVLGIFGEWLFIFRDLGSTGNYFRGAGEQAHSFVDLGITKCMIFCRPLKYLKPHRRTVWTQIRLLL